MKEEILSVINITFANKILQNDASTRSYLNDDKVMTTHLTIAILIHHTKPRRQQNPSKAIHTIRMQHIRHRRTYQPTAIEIQPVLIEWLSSPCVAFHCGNDYRSLFFGGGGGVDDDIIFGCGVDGILIAIFAKECRRRGWFRWR